MAVRSLLYDDDLEHYIYTQTSTQPPTGTTQFVSLYLLVFLSHTHTHTDIPHTHTHTHTHTHLHPHHLSWFFPWTGMDDCWISVCVCHGKETGRECEFRLSPKAKHLPGRDSATRAATP